MLLSAYEHVRRYVSPSKLSSKSYLPIVNVLLVSLVAQEDGLLTQVSMPHIHSLRSTPFLAFTSLLIVC